MAILCHRSPVADTHRADLDLLNEFGMSMRAAALTLITFRYLQNTYPENARRWITPAEVCEFYGIGSDYANSLRNLLTERHATLQAMRIKGIKTTRRNTGHLVDVHTTKQSKRSNGMPLTRYLVSWHQPEEEPKIGVLCKKSADFLRAWFIDIFEDDRHNPAPRLMRTLPGEIHTVLPFRYAKKPYFPQYQPPNMIPKRDPDGRYFGCGLCGYEWKSRLPAPLSPKRCPMCKNKRILPLTVGDAS